MSNGRQDRWGYLYGLSGVVLEGKVLRFLDGCLHACSAEAARANHLDWMRKQSPDGMILHCNVFLIDDDLVIEAAEDAKKGSR